MANEDNPSAPGRALEAAIIIPHYNDGRRLRLCLAALAPQVGPNHEVAVVDNASSEDLTWVRRDFPFVQLLTQPEKGAANARNMGVERTTAPRLLFVDADCVPASDWVARSTAAIADQSVVGGKVDVHDETAPPRSGAEAFEAVFAFNFKRYIETVGFTGAGNMITWRSIFNDVGGFRHGVSEDIDWSRRAVAAGHSITFAPDVVVSHPTRSDWKALRHKWLRLTEEMFSLREKTARARLLWSLRAIAVLCSPARDGFRLLASARLADSTERARGLLTLLRLRGLRAVWMLRQAVGLPIR